MSAVATIFNILKKLLYIYLKGGFTEARRDKEKSFIHWFIPQMATIARAEQGARSILWVFQMGAGTQGLGPSSTAFPRHKQGAGLEVEKLEHVQCPC